MVLDEAGDTGCKHTRLARPRAGDDQQWTFIMENGFALCGVEPSEGLCVTGRGV